MATDARIQPVAPAAKARSIDWERIAFWSLTAIVLAAQAAFALIMNERGYLWGDAVSRSAAALIALHSADPHLAAIGMVWLPLPTLLTLAPVAFYPDFPNIVANGFASSLISVLAGVLNAAIVFGTARKLTLSLGMTLLYTLLVAFSPMLFLFATNGMSEGIATPFLIGSVCCLMLFWEGGQRRYVAASGVLVAIGFACLYQAVFFGAALWGALVLGLFTSENSPSAPQGRFRAVEGLSLLFLVPIIYVAVIWLITNFAIMGDPFYFATSIYSNEGYIAATGQDRLANAVTGDIVGSIEFAVIRSWPFLIPLGAILLVRLIEGRLFRSNSLTMVGVALVVPVSLIIPQLYDGTSFGWLRYFHYPLFVAAGWGLYEIARSRHRNIAMMLIFGGWIVCIPASLYAMNNPAYGQNEYQVLRSVWTGDRAEDVGYPMYFEDVRIVAAAIDGLEPNALVMADSSNAWTIAGTVNPASLKHKLLLTSDDRFHDALEDPAGAGVRYILAPNPRSAPQDLINAEFPLLWQGSQPGFTLVRDFAETGTGWRLYRVVP